MPATITLIMLGIGLELKFRDFIRVFTKPKAILIGLGCQLFLLPGIALALIYYWPMENIYKVGVMLLAACPGGTASNLVTKMLGGRIALSVSLTAFNSFLILFTIPVIVELSYFLFSNGTQSLDLGFWETAREILLTVLLPVLIGIIIGGFLTDSQQQKLHKPLRILLPLLLLVAVFAVISLDDSEQNIHYLKYVPLLLPLFLLNILTMIAGFITAKSLQLRHRSAYTIAIEMGLQNSVLALYIGNQLLQNQNISLMAILYGSFSLLTTFGLAYILKRFQFYEK
ncbi:bile acid:sodium symporter family protein [Christiangramia aquimixticola]|uniref:bile acid:sodium symporter family protein n=1 Tax=Christiangramia aquimixticola TaxID=1697558 RepID=UPI003AA90AEC